MKKTKLVIILIALLSLSACASMSSMPSMLPKHLAQMTLDTAIDVNANQNFATAPLYVIVYQLKSPELFNQASFLNLANHGNVALAGSFLASEAYYLQSGKQKKISLTLNSKTKYLGVFADYHNMQQATWRKIIPLKSSWGKEKLHLQFTRKGIQVIYQ